MGETGEQVALNNPVYLATSADQQWLSNIILDIYNSVVLRCHTVSDKHGEDTVIILESGGRKVTSMRNNVGFDVCSNITFILYQPTHCKHITRMLHIQSHSLLTQCSVLSLCFLQSLPISFVP